MAKRVEDIREFVPGMAAMSLNSDNGRAGSQWNVESASFVPGQVSMAGMGQRMMTPPLPGYPGFVPQGAYMPSPGMPDQSGLTVEDFPPMQRGQQQQQGPSAQYPNNAPNVAGSGRGYGGGNPKGNQKYYKQQQQQQAAQQQPASAVPHRMNPAAQYFPPSTSDSAGADYYGARPGAPYAAAPTASSIVAGGPSVGTPPPGRKLIQSFFMSDTLRADLQKKTLLQLRGTNPDDPLVQNLPKTIHRYHSLYPLEDITKDKAVSRVFGMPSFCYKAISMTDGKSYVLRKVDAPRGQQYDYGMQAVELWKSVQHPGVVGLKEVFVSPAFNNINSLFFVYEYFPGAETLELKFPIGDKSRPGAFISEESLWSFLIQLVAAIKAVHDAGLAARTVLASKVLLTGKNRIRLNCVGIDDFFNYDMRRNSVQAKQMEDIVSLGKLMVRLASPTVEITNPNQLPRALEAIAASYSPEFHQLLLRMLGLSGPASNQRRGGQAPAATFPTLDEIQAHLTPRVFGHIDKLYSYNDSLENEMAKEIENGRLVRLLIKLGFVNERPEYDMSAGWSETGDRYLLKLFRDYVFHQVDEDGAPVLDFSHVVESLNKLDMGAEEKILLTSRDEKSMLVLSFKDLRRCLAEAFTELVQRQQQAQAQQQQQPQQGSNPQGSSSASSGSQGGYFPPGASR